MKADLVVNGKAETIDIDPGLLLVELLRDRLALTGTKIGCESSSCGACTILADGAPVKSCTMLAVQADGLELTTIEGLTPSQGLSPIQEAFRAEHGLQCGFCTPGMVVMASALLAALPSPSPSQIREWLDGNLCRCTGYVGIIRAVEHAAAVLAGGEPVVKAGRPLQDPVAATTVDHTEISGTDIEVV